MEKPGTFICFNLLLFTFIALVRVTEIVVFLITYRRKKYLKILQLSYIINIMLNRYNKKKGLRSLPSFNYLIASN